MSFNDKMSDMNVQVCQRLGLNVVAWLVFRRPPVKHSKPARVCSTIDQLRFLQALEDIESDKLSGNVVYECISH